MYNHTPRLTPSICRIFREWADASVALLDALPGSAIQKPRMEQAAETVAMLGMTGEKNVTVLMLPSITYSKIEFMALVMESAQINHVITDPRLPGQIEEVRSWLLSNQ